MRPFFHPYGEYGSYSSISGMTPERTRARYLLALPIRLLG